MNEIFAVKLEKCSKNLIYEKMLSLVSKNTRKKAKKFLNIKDAYRTLMGELLIKKIASQKLQINNSEIKFVKNKYGKPFLKDYTSFCFNISHSGNWVVCVIDNELVGIDIQKIKSIDYLNLAKKFFSREEYNDLLLEKEENKLNYFYDLWTLKESYIKAIGKGLSLSLDSFRVKKINNLNIDFEAKKNLNQYNFRMYDIDLKYKLAVCSKTNNLSNNVKIRKVSDLLNL